MTRRPRRRPGRGPGRLPPIVSSDDEFATYPLWWVLVMFEQVPEDPDPRLVGSALTATPASFMAAEGCAHGSAEALETTQHLCFLALPVVLDGLAEDDRAAIAALPRETLLLDPETSPWSASLAPWSASLARWSHVRMVHGQRSRVLSVAESDSRGRALAQVPLDLVQVLTVHPADPPRRDH
jgi:hypothetical protein